MDLQKEREVFEAVTNIYHCIYNTDLNYYFSGSKFVGDKAEIEVNAGWRAWQAAKAQAVPEVLRRFCNEHKDPAWRGRLNEYDKGYRVLRLLYCCFRDDQSTGE